MLGTFQGEALVFKQLVHVADPAGAWGRFFVMYIILGILYESYVHPITVLSTLPPAIVGGLGTLWVFQLQRCRFTASSGCSCSWAS